MNCVYGFWIYFLQTTKNTVVGNKKILSERKKEGKVFKTVPSFSTFSVGHLTASRYIPIERLSSQMTKQIYK
jgi:hypothetical protein